MSHVYNVTQHPSSAEGRSDELRKNNKKNPASLDLMCFTMDSLNQETQQRAKTASAKRLLLWVPQA